MKRIYFYSAAVLLLGFTMWSCKKDSTTDPLVASSQDNAEVSSLYDDVDNEANNVSNLKDVLYDTTGSSGTKTVVKTKVGDTAIWTITFTTYNNGKNARLKNGTMIIKTAGKYAGETIPYFRSITFSDFTIDGNKIEGLRTIERDTVTDPTGHTFSITLTNGKVTFPDNTTYTRTTENRKRIWIKGYDTPLWIWDDEYDITGSATGTNRQGYAYTHSITTPLHVALICPWIESGVIQMTVTEGTTIKTSTLDYGADVCDKLATLTITGGSTTVVNLKGGK
jgi:hypothetical protein